MKAGLQCLTDGIPVILLYVFFSSTDIYVTNHFMFEESWGTRKQLHWEAAWTLCVSLHWKRTLRRGRKIPFCMQELNLHCQWQGARLNIQPNWATALPFSPPPPPPPTFCFLPFIFVLFFPLKTDLVLLHLHIYGCKNKVAEQSSELLKKPFILHS